MFVRSTRLLARLSLVFVLAAGLVACDSSEPDPVTTPPVITPPPTTTPPPAPAAPVFPVASRPVALNDGTSGLQFFMTPSENARITRIDIRNPVNQTRTFNANEDVALQGVTFNMQEPDFIYFRISGEWSFTIIGATSPASVPFSVVETVTVGARPAGPDVGTPELAVPSF